MAQRMKVSARPVAFLKASIFGITLAFIILLILPFVRDGGGGGSEAVKGPQPAAATGALPKSGRLPAALPPNPPQQQSPPQPEPPQAQPSAQEAPPTPASSDPNAIQGSGALPAPDKADSLDQEEAEAKAEEEKPGAEAAPDETEPQPGEASAPKAVASDDYPFPASVAKGEMDDALKPLLAFELGDADVKALKETMSLADRQKLDEAHDSIGKIGDRSARLFATWYWLRLADLGASSSEIEDFVSDHPRFPWRDVLASRLETALFWENGSTEKVARFIGGEREPVSGVGKALLGSLLISRGERERGLELIRTVWHSSVLDGPLEEKFRARFGGHLTQDDDALREKAKEFRKLKDKVALAPPAAKKKAKRSRKGRSHHPHRLRHGRHKPAAKKHRKGKTHIQRKRGRKHGALEATGDAARRFARALTSAVIPAAEAKPALPEKKEPAPQAAATPLPEKRPGETGKITKAPAQPTAQDKAAGDAFDLEKEASADPAHLYARVKRLRRTNHDREAWSLIRSMSPEDSDLIAPGVWWDERRLHVRAALDASRPHTAYALASEHGPLSGDDLAEAEFLAGWIALRFLKDPGTAEEHFRASQESQGILPRYRARAAYFLGRAEAEQGRTKEANADFAEAAKHYFTYYGQLAGQARNAKVDCQFRPPARPSAADIEAFVNSDAVRAVLIAKQIDSDRMVRVLMLGFAREWTNPAQMTLFFELARRIAPASFVVRLAKIALNRDFPVDIYSFPRLLPEFDALGQSENVEHALLHALTRQESEFNAGAVSPAGARGLMQLMPSTARHVASQHKVKFELRKLTADPAYNVMLGAAFLSRLISSYNGSYVMAVAAYNAGPGRVREWVKDFGDPRRIGVDPIDWVERIPFTETRNYVQRVLEGLQLYRCRFEDAKTRVLLVNDLHRGRPDGAPGLIEAGTLDH
jgi:soluble lytic murein transglycosylase